MLPMLAVVQRGGMTALLCALRGSAVILFKTGNMLGLSLQLKLECFLQIQNGGYFM